MKGCHNDMGLLRLERILSLVRDRFFSPNRSKDVEKLIKKCHRCLCFQRQDETATLSPILATHPLQLVQMIT